MTMSIAARFYFILFILGWIINLIESWYYGWNWKPMSPGEQGWDVFTSIMIFVGFIGMIVCRWNSK